ncbi:D-amino acid oxidase, putative [Talaromyces stipitatus ATCC 10500]|uniref:D-amino acid oxidase, putative n=1 Tax=Talaromyces stipitatus (strain ATCC 10500 / CBS 375.48 / QM 6759 / NRRL 1006) TaxID=441959 RepID=B8MEF6_TALSN|nr:D-amino acid oxidase, putative [Talaromyces stipitatus ATCC 10500]EED16583.1 D-amino acid oxidase, putative [Talaromyces stipitatus ATCC 10500]
MARDSIVILGAGIIGLDVAIELSKRGYGKYVTVIAEHLPGDTSIDYTSPWAGANFSGISGGDANALRWDRAGYTLMMEMIDKKVTEARYLEKTESTEYWDEMPQPDKIQSMTEYLRDLVIIPKSELPKAVAFGIKFTTVTINAPAHCQHLKTLLSEPEYGSVPFIRRRASRLQDAFLSENTKLVFNCIGNSAITLSGVSDAKCYPTRGQILLVKAPSVKQNIMRHGNGYETYVIPRPLSDGSVILGGYMQKGNSFPNVKEEETKSILQRTGELLPVLLNGEVEIIGAVVGLRPSREGGARVEQERISDKIVIHNYGAGGTGFQAGIGMAVDAVDLAAESLKELNQKSML